MSALFLLTENTFQENADTDHNQNHTAKNGGFSCKLGAEFATDAHACKANGKGDNTDHTRGEHCLKHRMIGNGKSDRQRINRGGNALYQQGGKGGGTRTGANVVLAFGLSALYDQFRADENKKT